MAARIPLSDAELTEQASQFAASIKAPRARWEYCLKASHYWYRTRRGDDVLCPNAKSMPTCAKVLGRRPFSVRRGFQQLRREGYEGALALEAEYRARYPGGVLSEGLFDVGPLKAWSVGHVYFARVVGSPHVVKIGFSRRVHERIDDIESATHARLMVLLGQLKVGTLLDEHWWHHNWRKFNIAGEWFFDPHMAERTVPDFLKTMAEAA